MLTLTSVIAPTWLPLTRAQEPAPDPATQQPQSVVLVESVDIQNNRRNRDEDLLYYVQTRAGDPYNPAQVERDFQALLQLGFFERTESRVLVQDGPRGGKEIIFDVAELPIIRDLQFEGLGAVPEADVLKAFREQRVGISKESILDPVKVNNARRVIRELLAARGYPNATVEPRIEEVSATSSALTFDVNQGERVRVADIQFEGNQVFSDGELRAQMKLVREAGLISRFRGQDILDRRKLEFDLNTVERYMRSKGYLQARTGEPRIEGIGQQRTGFFIPLPLLSSTDDALRVTIPVTEGKIYRLGEIKIEGNSIFSEDVIRNVIGLKPGEIADGDRLGKALYEDLKKIYGASGFIQYAPEVQPEFRDNPANPNEGIADFTVTIDEGKQFTLRRLEFIGNTFTRDNVLRREVLLNEGDVYNQIGLENSVLRLNQLGFFDPIDDERDIDFRQNDDEGLVDVNIRVAERGRNQISFNGGISGIGGSFFGFEYSTNNLLGRGETLSANVAFGNRQRSIVFSFTEPYIRDRPISAGFTLFSTSRKFFGAGTFLSDNVDAQINALNPLGNFNVDEANLFTETSNGASLFLSAPLSEFYRKRRFTQFSRIGLSYSLAQTSVRDPQVNEEGDLQQFIPVVYRQPNILTSRITPTFVFDTRNGSIDPTNGKQFSLSIALAGLGGDVRTYQPFASYSQFIPVRRTGRGQNPEVFAFRILAGHTSSFAQTSAIREANSLAFINGVPIFERFFLGDEFTIRGYEPRQITPFAFADTFISSRNPSLSTASAGTVTDANRVTGIQGIEQLGTLTGEGAVNPAFVNRFPVVTGGDTQLLGNFEYRVPIFGPVSVAAFADIGSAFNLRKGRDQFINSEFLADDRFLPSVSRFIVLDRGQQVIAPLNLSTLAIRNNPALALSPSGGLVVRDNRFVTQSELNQALTPNVSRDPLTGLPFGFQQVFLRGDVQTNQVVRISESVFDSIRDYRASVGAELRIQVPVVNVPFRLIYAFNPNARRGTFEGIPFFEKRSVFRFSIGRTF